VTAESRFDDWSPCSWRTQPAAQQPVYDSPEEVDRVVAEIAALPPLVTSWEIEDLKSQLADAARGDRFVLQGGDCAESFEDCRPGRITNLLKILLQMSLVLVQGSKKRVTRIGRMAGQYAKPRSDDFETRDGVTLAAYRGDIINRMAFTEADRRPDPWLMLRGYERSALTVNFVRALVKGGFADLHHPEYWDLDFVQHSGRAAEYQGLARSIHESLQFMENVLGLHIAEMDWVDFFTSHEGLHLPYEQAQTRRVPRRTGWYNLSTHFPWIGMRTAAPDGAHVEFFRGIANPVGLKVGPDFSSEDLLRTIDILHPVNEPGRLTLIHRFGADRVADRLPALLETVRRSGRVVAFICDAMHGNTRKTKNGFKTRHFADIVSELEQSFDIHAAYGGALGGVHFELTGEDVTECVGGARGLGEEGLSRAYKSQVDPRLNYEQALEMAMVMARHMSRA
jgi:3-deoxy-7-phosphoheptulonate synthase